MRTLSFLQATNAIQQYLEKNITAPSHVQYWVMDIIHQGFQDLAYTTPKILAGEYQALMKEKIWVEPRPTQLEPTPRSINETELQNIQNTLSSDWLPTQPYSLDHATIWAIDQVPNSISFISIPNHPNAPLVIHHQPTDQWHLTTLSPTHYPHPSSTHSTPLKDTAFHVPIQ